MTPQEYYRSLHKYSDKPPVLFEFTDRELFSYFFANGLIFFVGLALLQTDNYVWVGWCLTGMGLGSFLRDIGWKRTSVRTWPLYSAVIDWDKVQSLAHPEEPSENEAAPQTTDGENS